ncbi:MAG: hypothetical protein AAF408_16125 [Pseudomonadota bacterium]
MKKILTMALLTGFPALAEPCPPAADHSAALDQLIAQAQAAGSAAEARPLLNGMWELWADAPDARSQTILDRGMSKRAVGDLAGALEAFEELVAYCPQYAEGYNQRAFVRYLQLDFATALIDLDRALDLSPRHVAALSGKALTLMGLSRLAEARDVFSEALNLNPWLPERGLADPGGPLEPLGQDI